MMEFSPKILLISGGVLIAVLFVFFARRKQTVQGGGADITRIENPDRNFSNEMQAREVGQNAFSAFLSYAQNAQAERLGLVQGANTGFQTGVSPITQEIEGRFAAFAQTPAVYEVANRRYELESQRRAADYGRITRGIDQMRTGGVIYPNQVFSPSLFDSIFGVGRGVLESFGIPTTIAKNPPIFQGGAQPIAIKNPPVFTGNSGGLLAGQYGGG